MAAFRMARFPCLCFLPMEKKKAPGRGLGSQIKCSNVLAGSQSLTSLPGTPHSQVFAAVETDREG